MDTESLFRFFLELTLEPIGTNPPQVTVSINDQIIFQKESIVAQTKISHDINLEPGHHYLKLIFQDKPHNDVDMAIKIKNISVNGISDPRFIWKGIYVPDYPELWATEQKKSGNKLAEEIFNTDYLGWNGTWTLEFTSPVFSWIHQTQDLGWTYD